MVAMSAGLGGCAPVVDVAGIYFPGWLVSVAGGIVFSYVLVSLIGRRGAGRELADSGLFFLGLVAVTSLSAWWLFFRGF
jgi:YtcA family